MLARIVFAVFVVLLGLDLGAGLYETRVLVPRWESRLASGAPAADPVLMISRDAGQKWWMGVTPSVGLFALLALITSLLTSDASRGWRIGAAALELAVVVTTITYFAPNIVRLLEPGRTLPGAEAAAQLRTWAGFNWVRVVATSAAWLTALRALSLFG